MGKKDARIDAYIAKSREFAQPILTHIRKLVHQACPEVAETIKWGFPHFEYKGILCSMAAFKNHCAFGFWKGSLMSDPHKIMAKGENTAMGQFGRITDTSELPADDVLIAYIKEAAKLNADGVKLPAKPKKPKQELIIPSYFLEAMRKNEQALATFEGFSYSNKKEYVEWITEAKTESTRKKRLDTAVQWLAEGKVRNWKYIKTGQRPGP